MTLGYSLGQIARVVKGTLLGDASTVVEKAVTDSREKCDDALFIALRGERFDGHDFAGIAATEGAKAVLVHKQIDGLMIPHILVKNTDQALFALGVAKRKEFSGKVAAVTGSSGKTTVRRLLHAILSKKTPTHQPIKNFNNHIGVPLTLLELDDAFGAAVLELGCSGFGEIETLTALSNPDVGLVTNVGPAHLEQLGSLEGVARAKGELFAGMRKDATAVINMDDERVAAMRVAPEKKITYSAESPADVRLRSRTFLGEKGQQLVLDIFGKTTEANLTLLGAHNATNALAAAAAATAFGMTPDDIQKGLASVQPEAGRLTPKSAPGGFYVLDDTYNANPSSMRAALNTLKEISENKRSVAVLGDMLELGCESDAAHIALGREAFASGVDLLIALGAKGRAVVHGAIQAGMDPAACAIAQNADTAADTAASIVQKGDWILVKGSRGMKMETVVDALLREND